VSPERREDISRRRFLGVSAAVLGLAGVGAPGCGGDGGDPVDPPLPPVEPARNLVIFIADDHRADVLGHLGHPVVRTPNIDQIASEGVSATRLFSVALDCQPARVSLFTSLYARTHGVTDNTAEVPDSLLFLAEVLRDTGFATGGFGKLHDGTNAGQGLLETKPFVGAKSPFYTQFIRWDNQAIESGHSGLEAQECPTHTITEQGLDFIRRNAQRRFFALISIPEPHPPYIAPEPYYSRIDPALVPATTFHDSARFWQSRNPRWVEYYRATWDTVSLTDLRRALATYYAKIEFVDAELGRVRQALQEEGILDQTVLLYISDHGEAAGMGGIMGKSGVLFDPIPRQPLVLRYPSLRAAGRKIEALLESVDVAPTLLDLLGVTVPSSFQGKVSTSVLRGGKPLRSDVIAMLPTGLEPGLTTTATDRPILARMVRTTRYKLIEYADGYQELYDLEQDPLEMDNRIATADPAVLSDLERRLARAG
jgi:arylsulfatase